MAQHLLGRLRENWKSGLTVSLVSIPLSVSLAVASQTSPTVGIITAVWAGFFAALFGGSNFNIVGPTGALSGILAAYAIAHGAAALPMLALVAGAIVIAAYFLRLGRFLAFVPASTMQGFTLGVAFIIGLNQMNFALGLSGLPKHEHFIDNVIESFRHLADTSVPSLIVFVVFLAGLFAALRVVPKIPGAVLLAPVGILLGFLSVRGVLPFGLETLSAKFPDIQPSLFVAPQLHWDSALIVGGFTVALVAILETMVSARIADGMTKTKHDEHKELLGLGVANIASGLMGGIPATAALARTSLNVKSGANDKASAVVSSVCIAVISVLLLSFFGYIPMPVIAAILVFVAIRMVEAKELVRIYRFDKLSFAVAVLVAAVTIAADPIAGILIGTTISLLLFMEQLSRGHFHLMARDASDGGVHFVSGGTANHLDVESDSLIYSIKGQLAYINSQAHLARFRQMKGFRRVVLRLRELYFIDLDGIDAFDELVEMIERQGCEVLVSGPSPLIDSMLLQSKTYRELKARGMVFEHAREALARDGSGSAAPQVEAPVMA
jgi:SulP family sulfate permease